MKKYSYGKLISVSWDWMCQILFRPFSLKKWIMLFVIVALAGQLGGGCNISLPGNNGDFDKIINKLKQNAAPIAGTAIPPQEITVQESQKITAAQAGVAAEVPSFSLEPRTIALLAVIVSVVLLFIGIFVLLWMWLTSNFSFVFIDSIVKNDASFRVPFHRNKAQGSSYFKWNIVFSSIALLVFGIILYFPIAQFIKAGVFADTSLADIGQSLSIALKYLPVLLLAGVIFFLIGFFTREFVLPIMYKRKTGILKAWGILLGIFKKNIGEIALFLLVRAGLFIVALAAIVILVIIGIIALLLIGGLIALLAWLIYTIMPAAAKTITAIIFVSVGIPIAMFLFILFNLIFLPIPVFFRTFSINVLGGIDESLDLFAPKAQGEIAAEGDDEKYKKSMRLVWFTVLFPFLVAIIAMLIAIAAPNFIKTNAPARNGIVTVYLKNGNSFQAKIEKESDGNIVFKVKGGTFILHRTDIMRIEE